ncbi:uncharacterized protein K02A2.6-like [Rhagoletis pomonella]|uniref:uncharacterized protein K02A2.6-like n=1 Tax=Rhagoletis pomonella TaxID=28610 RepID=UPI0017829EF7|nr:uncharacterized protein K02A2.6-like [Rhagoletis pomonella]
MDEAIQAVLKQMQKQQKLQHDDMQTLMEKLLSKEPSQLESNASSSRRGPASPEFILEALAVNISEFCFDAENNITFDTWFARYEDLFAIDAAKLDDAAKVRLLLRKLNTAAHSKYINYILPNHPREFSFDCTVQKLTQLFGSQKSIFNARFNCLQVTKDANMDFLTYTGMVNKHCEKFKLNELTVDQFKCLVFVISLKSETDFEIRTKLLSKIDSEASTITLEIISRECQRIINLKSDTALVEKQNFEVQQVKAAKNTQNMRRTPNSPCWFCGSMHYARNCSFKNHKCKKCNTTGHKDGYCKVKKVKQHENKGAYTKKKSNTDTMSKTIFAVNNISSRKFTKVNINGIEVRLQLDTGSDITIISKEVLKRLPISKMDEVTRQARSATGELPLIAQFECDIEFQNRKAITTCYATSVKKLNVMGLDWIRALRLDDMPINAICQAIETTNYPRPRINENKVKEVFPDLFENKMGLYNKSTAHLYIKKE